MLKCFIFSLNRVQKYENRGQIEKKNLGKVVKCTYEQKSTWTLPAYSKCRGINFFLPLFQNCTDPNLPERDIYIKGVSAKSTPPPPSPFSGFSSLEMVRGHKVNSSDIFNRFLWNFWKNRFFQYRKSTFRKIDYYTPREDSKKKIVPPSFWRFLSKERKSALVPSSGSWAYCPI